MYLVSNINDGQKVDFTKYFTVFSELLVRSEKPSLKVIFFRCVKINQDFKIMSSYWSPF